MMVESPEPDAAGFQPHGLLFVLQGGELLIRHHSANAARQLGRETARLEGRAFLDLVDPAARLAVAALLRDAGPAGTGRFELSFRPPDDSGAPLRFDAAARSLDAGHVLIEMERDPAPRIGGFPQPGSASALRLIRRTSVEASRLTRPEDIADVLARGIRGFTGFERVRVERFAADGSGLVIAEASEDGTAPLVGQHAPVVPGRENEPRYVFDASARAVPLVPPVDPRNGASSGLARATLRSPSSAEVRHWAGLELATVLTVPIGIDGHPWGRVVCHHRRPKYLAPDPREAVELCVSVAAGRLGELARADLERANQELRRFAAVIAHEVRNQLQPGMLALSTLRAGLAAHLTPEHATVAAVGERSLSGLVKFTSELLHFAEAEATVLLEEVELQAVAEQVVGQLRLESDGAGAVVALSPLPRIRALREQMHHLLLNLLKNAMLHGGNGTRRLRVDIGFEVHPSHGPVVFVKDDGRGIPAEQQLRLFEFFTRGVGSRSPGSGIGLAYCAQVARRHGGRLWVESTPGQGAAFYFTVTLADALLSQAAT